ncbi:MAG TPA: N-6 DNA methylase, partial [Leptospiraceae bacterium]|nr:N-6 DNA methylase [Leptospiraceae bacterium]
MSLEYIRLEGGLFSPDFLESIETRKGQKSEDFGLEGKVSLVEEISARWNYIQSLQTVFEHKKEKATKKGESLLGVTREHWVIPFLEELGYFEINYQKKQTIVGEKKFEISHRDGKEEGKGIPILINSESDDIDKSSVAAQGRISSAHSVLQDYLNRTDEDLWGIVTNGRVIRVLRNSAFLTRQAYLEFDLESILRNRKYDEFKILYRILHRSRFPKSGLPASSCLLEEYRQDAIDEGGRIRDGLRIAVERSIEDIGNGFVQHKANESFRNQIRNKEIIARDYYQQILYLIYRILFLFTAEERGLIVPKENNPAAKEYLLKNLRERSKRMDATEKRFVDVYYHLKTLFAIYRDSNLSELAGFPPLNGELFKEYSIIDAFELDNYMILRVFQSLSYFKPEGEKIQRRVNYAALDVEELGSVYESLLDFYPRLDEEKGIIRFSLGAGTERKATGSHYTHHDLVIETLKTSLIPVMEERLKAATSQQLKEKAILSMKVCDPACGSGHLLLSSARIMGKELARIREGQDEPNPIEVRKAVRDVISHCIYGVDKNPLAVDLCKVALWIEGYAEGKPLTFLDHRIRCGDSLVGVFSAEQLKAGIPDGAYTAVSGDDKKIAQFYKKDNQGKKKGEQELFIDEPGNKILVHSLQIIQEIESLEDDSPENVRAKKQMYEEMHKEIHFKREKLACDLWTFAFFQNLTLETQNKKLIPTTEDIRSAISGGNVNPNL